MTARSRLSSAPNSAASASGTPSPMIASRRCSNSTLAGRRSCLEIGLAVEVLVAILVLHLGSGETSSGRCRAPRPSSKHPETLAHHQAPAACRSPRRALRGQLLIGSEAT
jgi:hypothetical protein